MVGALTRNCAFLNPQRCYRGSETRTGDPETLPSKGLGWGLENADFSLPFQGSSELDQQGFCPLTFLFVKMESLVSLESSFYLR